MNKLIITTLSLAAAICLCGCQKESESDGEYKMNETDDVCTKMTDKYFQQYCYNNFDIDHNGKVSMSEAEKVYVIECSTAEDFTGIEYFTNLEKLISTSVRKADLTNSTKLTYIDLQKSPIEKIDLSNSTKLTYIDLHGSSIEEIDLSNCEDLVTLNEMAFFHCTSLTSVSFPGSLTTIGGQAFGYCTSLTSMTLPESLTEIGDYAFDYCTSLASVSFPEGLTTIGGYAFFGCTNLTSVTLPEGLTTIGQAAFFYCTSLSSVTCEAVTPPALGNGSFVFYGIDSSAVLYVPAESVDLYKASDWAQCFSAIEVI